MKILLSADRGKLYWWKRSGMLPERQIQTILGDFILDFPEGKIPFSGPATLSCRVER